MRKMLFTMVALSVVLGANAPFAGAEGAKAKSTKQSAKKLETCSKCKKAEKDCVCEDKDKHEAHDHGAGNHEHKDEKKTN